MSNSKQVQALCDFQSGVIDILHLVVRSTNLDLITKELVLKLESMPNFFDEEAILIDLRELSDPTELNLSNFKKILKKNRIELAGVVVDDSYMSWVKNNGLIAFDSRRAFAKRKAVIGAGDYLGRECKTFSSNFNPTKSDLNLDCASILEVPAEENVLRLGTMIIDKQLRSGQRIYAQGNLVILAIVNAGAEIIAEGDIHIYAPLRGRALAGVKGNLRAKIFCTNLSAELVSIAGIYRTAENLINNSFQNKSAQISLQGESLIFEPLLIN